MGKKGDILVRGKGGGEREGERERNMERKEERVEYEEEKGRID